MRHWPRWRRPMAARPVLAPPILTRLGRSGADPAIDLLWEHAGGALVAIDLRGLVVAANDAARELLGEPVEPRGPVLELFAAEARAVVWAEIAAALPGSARRAPLSVSLATGAIVAVAVVAIPSRQSGGQGALLRLTGLRRQRADEARQAEARQATTASCGIAHDLNNLLAVIQGGAEAVAGQAGLSAEVAGDVALIRAAAGRGGQLVRRLLGSGREEAPEPRRVAVPAAVAGLASLLRRLLGQAIRLELATDGDAASQAVMVDPVQLDRVLVNLAVNARDAMPVGGELRIQSRPVTVRRPHATGAEVVPPGRWVIVEVRDTGVGIAPETLPRVLEPYFTTRREHGGHGLGLSTVHGIVREAGGFLAIESAVGVGTCVRVWLPACGDAPRSLAPAASGPPTQSDAGGRTVLLVDDEEPVRRLAERALTRQGWRVLSADSAEAALATLDAEPAGGAPLAVMVSDIVMPGLDGAALVELIRARAGQAALPVLLVSGYSDTSLGAAITDRPPTVFLPKPYSLGDLVSRVATLAGPAATA